MTRLNEIGIMRFVLILSIVIGHTFAIYGIAAERSWTLPENFENVESLWWINPVFISFSLQAFVFISGYLMRMQVSLAPIDKHKFISKKIKRLFVPLIVFGLLYWLIIDRYMFNDIYDWINYFLSGPGHLWFLAMLFLCFIAMIVNLGVEKIISRSRIVKALYCGVLLLIYFSSLFVPDDFRIAQLCQYYIYFVVGYWSYDYRSKLKSVTWPLILIFILITVILIGIKLYLFQNKPDHYYLLSHINKLFLGIFGSYLTLMLCIKCPEGTYLSEIGAWNGFFGVYIFHQFILRYIYYKTDWLIDVNKYIVGIVALITTLLISWLLSQIFLRFKFTRRLI